MTGGRFGECVCVSVCVSIGAQHNADCLAIWRVLRCSCSFRCILSVHPSPSAFLAFASAVIPLNDAERIRQKRLLVKAPCYRYRNERTGSGDEKDYAMTKLKTRLPSADGTSSSGPALPPRWFRLDDSRRHSPRSAGWSWSCVREKHCCLTGGWRLELELCEREIL